MLKLIGNILFFLKYVVVSFLFYFIYDMYLFVLLNKFFYLINILVWIEYIIKMGDLLIF